MTRSALILFGATMLLGMSTLAFAQTRGPQGAGRGAPQGGRNYDPASEVTMAGTIDDVRNVTAPANGLGGLHLTVRGDAGVLDVHLGPASFVKAKHFEFAKGDAITVTGSKVKIGGQDVVIAREVTKGGQVLTLRDAKGFPLWSGRARGAR
jgi:DNA/RNA endonuclease YhcR with UshA esterase domain